MTTSLRRGFCLQWQRTILCECALLRYYGFIVSSLLIEVVVLQRLNPGPVVLLVQAKPGVGVWVGEGSVVPPLYQPHSQLTSRPAEVRVQDSSILQLATVRCCES